MSVHNYKALTCMCLLSATTIICTGFYIRTHMQCITCIMCRCVKLLHLPGVKTENRNESDINIVDNDGNTAFHLACLNGHFTVVNYLCTVGANLEAWYVRM